MPRTSRAAVEAALTRQRALSTAFGGDDGEPPPSSLRPLGLGLAVAIAVVIGIAAASVVQDAREDAGDELETTAAVVDQPTSTLPPPTPDSYTSAGNVRSSGGVGGAGGTGGTGGSGGLTATPVPPADGTAGLPDATLPPPTVPLGPTTSTTSADEDDDREGANDTDVVEDAFDAPSVSPARNAVTVVWPPLPPDLDVRDVRVDAIVASGPSEGEVRSLHVSPYRGQATVPALRNGVPYEVTVSAITPVAEHRSVVSPTVIPLDVLPGQPQPPGRVVAVPANGAATVSWSPPIDDGGAPLVGYQVTASPGGRTITVDRNVTRATVPDLANGYGYTFTVTAYNPYAIGTESTASNTVVPDNGLVGQPSPPREVRATPGDGSAIVEWLAPRLSGGTAITRYTVLVFPTGQAVEVAGTATRIVVNGLTNGRTYTFSVLADNGTAVSARSPESEAVTPDPRHATAAAVNELDHQLDEALAPILGLLGAHR